jgi:hypothetical protein
MKFSWRRKTTEPEAPHPLYRHLRQRAHRLTLAGRTFLVFVVALLAVGGAVFYFAYQIASSEDPTKQKTIANIIADLDNALRAPLPSSENVDPSKKDAIESLDKDRREILARVRSINLQDMTKPVEIYLGKLNDLTTMYMKEGNLSQINALAISESNVSLLFTTLISVMHQPQYANKDSNAAPITNPYVFAGTQITRFGTLTVILFLVTIFVTMYRYTVRLAAYYDARADALLLTLRSPEARFDLEEYMRAVRALTPDAYDFGRLPRSPTQEVVQLAKEVVARAGDRLPR